jgi:DNA polymerase-1
MPRTNAKNAATKKTIVILDSHAIIHRAYHALPSFVNSAGEPTGALYGLLSMLLRIIEMFKPNQIVAAFDLPKPTFRHQVYDAYKAGRAKTDDELVLQLQSARTLFEIFGIPVLDAEGFEADDVVGTLAKKLIDPSWRVIIASGDMDTLQLVEGDRITVFTLRKGVTDTVLYDEKAVEARYGFSPEQLIDYKGLRGDPSDNIIGIPGIGEKTATTLIQTFGTIEGIYKALEKNDEKTKACFKEIKITDRIQTLLREHKDDALFSKTLATIRTDAPIAFEPQSDYHRNLDEARSMEYLHHMEFKSLIPRVKKLFFEAVPVEKADTRILASEKETVTVSGATVQQAAIALWVLKSDLTMADEATILIETNTDSIEAALEQLIEALKAQNLYELYEKLELPLLPIVRGMHEWGIEVDPEALRAAGRIFSQKMETITREAYRLAGREFNLGSPKQLSELLFDELGLTPKGKRKASGAYTTNAEVLEGMRELHPIIPLILEYREVQKLQSTYIEPILSAIAPDGRVHAQFYQNGTTTGRFSSAHPNLQNLPMGSEYAKDIRAGFIAGRGNVLVSADYSQIELRVLAMLSGDEKLIETFQEGKDIHAAVASEIFGVPESEVTGNQRRAAKVVNFGILYGMGVTALQKNLGSSREEAARFYDHYFKSFPRITAFLENTKLDAARLGYTTTLFGRRRYFPGIKSPLPHIRAFAERMATNAPIQGTAADLVKVAILLIDEMLRTEKLDTAAHLVMQIHDELVYEVEKEYADRVKEIVETCMRDAIRRSPVAVPETDVPLEVSSATGERLDQLK